MRKFSVGADCLIISGSLFLKSKSIKDFLVAKIDRRESKYYYNSNFHEKKDICIVNIYRDPVLSLLTQS